MTPAALREALDRLNFFGIKLGLVQTRKLFELAGASFDQRYIHIAGTNGKGSTGAMLEAGLRRCGFRTGFYSSPHLIDVRERFRVNGQSVSEDAMEEAFLRTDFAAEKLRKAGMSPTYFEYTTVMAALIFQQAGADFVIWETGMGGRLDATSVVEPEAAVITNIALDHQQYLGDTLAAIAGEKAGIIVPYRPVFTGFLGPEAKQVIRNRAIGLHAPFFDPDPLSLTGEPRYRQDPDGGIVQEFRYGTGTMHLRLAGAMQRRNFLTAVPVLRYLADKYHFSPDEALGGVSSARWPARCQEAAPDLVVDGGHNPDGAAALAQAMLEAYPGRKFAVVFAGFRDKHVAENLRLISPLAAAWFFTPMGGGRPSHTGPELVQMAEEAGSRAPARVFANSREALAAARASSFPVLSAGSLLLAGEVLQQAAPESVWNL